MFIRNLIICMFVSVVLLSTSAFAGSVSISWTAPTTNADGTPLTDLASYRVYWSLTAGTYDIADSVLIPTGQTSTVVTLPTEGVWNFVATAIDNTGNESERSNELIKDMNVAPQKLTIEFVTPE